MNEHPKRYLITGASGFLGHHLIDTILHKEPNAQLIMLVRRVNHAAPKLDKYLILLGELDQPELWQDNPIIQHLDGIFHLAAEVNHDPAEKDSVFRSNINGTLGMVRLAQQKKCRLVFVSTSGTVGCFKKSNQFADENAPFCALSIHASPYYQSKIVAEKEAMALAQANQVSLVILRPSVMLGPNDHRFRTTEKILKLLRGDLRYLVKGEIAFTDVRDCAQAILEAMRHPNPRPVYHLTQHLWDLNKFYTECTEIAQIKPYWKILSRGLLIKIAWVNDFLSRPFKSIPEKYLLDLLALHWDARSIYAASELGFIPRGARETLSDTITWLQKNYKN